MNRQQTTRIAFALMLCFSAGIVAAQKPSKPPKKAASGDQGLQKAPARVEDPAKYVGSETCKGCHEETFKNFEKTPHWKTTGDTRRGVAWQGCEGCHGPGADHVAGGGDKSKIFTFKGVSASKVSERCLECHTYGEEHSNYARSAHKTAEVSCVDCHSPHHAKQKEFLLVDKQPQLCYTCHLEAKADFTKAFHHRVNEGLVKCSDCHNQHGGFVNRQMRSTAAQDAVCFKCHVDKAGPFAFEHGPVKTEGCVACHTPHGSSNPRLLKRSQVNLLCLECHTITTDSPAPGTPSFHNQAQKYQACTLCHTQIHGSNFSNRFFK